MSNKVPQLRFNGYSDAWVQRKLTDGYKKIRNAFVGTATPFYVETGHFYLESNNVKNGQLNFNSKVFINDEFYQKQTDLLLNTGDLVMVQSGHVGHTAVIPQELDGTAAHALIMFKNNDGSFDSEFINQYFQTKRARNAISIITTGNTIKHILASDMQKFEVTVPSVDEQKRISLLLRKLDNLIAANQRKLDLLKEQKKGYLQKMFPKNGEKVPELRFAGFADDWEQRELGDIVNWSKGDKLAKEKLNENGDGEPVIHYANLYKFSPVVSDVINWSTSNEGRLIPDNSILFPMSDVTPVGLARATTITKSGVKAGGDTLIGTIDSQYSAQFVSYYINANSDKILPLVTGTTVRHINSSSLSKLIVSLPDIKEQKQISDFLNSIQETIALHQRKLDLLKEHKKGFLQKMFV